MSSLPGDGQLSCHVPLEKRGVCAPALAANSTRVTITPVVRVMMTKAPGVSIYLCERENENVSLFFSCARVVKKPHEIIFPICMQSSGLVLVLGLTSHFPPQLKL